MSFIVGSGTISGGGGGGGYPTFTRTTGTRSYQEIVNVGVIVPQSFYVSVYNAGAVNDGDEAGDINVDGVAVSVGQIVTYEGYTDLVTNEVKMVGGFNVTSSGSRACITYFV
jgi:hypothetical protein